MFSTDKKTSKAKTEVDAAWFTLPEMYRAFDLSAQGFHKSIRPLIHESDIKGDGKRDSVRIRCRGAIDSYATKQAAKLVAKNDALLAGSDSPELERYRKARADLAELELGERNGSLIAKAQLEPAFAAYASAVRRAGEALARLYGNPAADLLNEALDDAERTIRQSFGGGNK